MAVDVERLVVNWLLTQTVVMDVVADRIYTDLPHDRLYPMVLVTGISNG
jgi:hypothetical protein